MTDRKSSIIKALDRQGTIVKIPGTDIDVKIVPLPAWLKIKIEDAQVSNSFRLSDYIYDIIIECILDPDTDEKIFSKADIPLLNSKDITKLEPLVIKIIGMSQIPEKELEELQQELKKMTS